MPLDVDIQGIFVQGILVFLALLFSLLDYLYKEKHRILESDRARYVIPAPLLVS